MDQVNIRLARAEDLPAVAAMHMRSMAQLGSEYYDAHQIEAVLAEGMLDPRIVSDGTYWLAEVGGRLGGSAGYTLRTPNYARLLAEEPRPMPPRCGRIGTVRSVFVEPRLARRGIGRALMLFVEARMRKAGVATAELMATLSGVRLYAALGYWGFEDHVFRLPGDVPFPVRRMVKPLGGRTELPVAA